MNSTKFLDQLNQKEICKYPSLNNNSMFKYKEDISDYIVLEQAYVVELSWKASDIVSLPDTNGIDHNALEHMKKAFANRMRRELYGEFIEDMCNLIYEMDRSGMSHNSEYKKIRTKANDILCKVSS